MTPMTKAELQQAYRIGRTTLLRWLKDVQINTGKRHILYGPELAVIFARFGKPNNIEAGKPMPPITPKPRKI